MSDQPGLARRLGTVDAVVIGLGSMIGAGVFSAFAPAAAAAGTGLLVGLGVAAVVAYCNATASAQLAAQYPTSGGTYVYGRERLGDWWGFLAGWGFVIGKTASCAAMALTFAAYAVPPAWQRPVAVAAVLALAAVNYRGVTRTARLTRVIVAVVLLTLAVVVAAGLLGGEADPGDLTDGVGGGPDALRGAAVSGPAVLRLRRLRPHRHDGRGGPRSAAHDPAGDRGRPRHHGRRVRGRRGGGAARARPGPARDVAGTAGRRRRRGVAGRGRCRSWWWAGLPPRSGRCWR